MVPTLPTLARLCRVYGVGLSYFFSDSEHHSLAISRKAHMCSPARMPETASVTSLHMRMIEGRLIARILQIPPECQSDLGEGGRREEVVAFVLEGRDVSQNCFQ